MAQINEMSYVTILGRAHERARFYLRVNNKNPLGSAVTHKYVILVLIGVKSFVNDILQQGTVTCQEAALCSHPTHRPQNSALKYDALKSNLEVVWFFVVVFICDSNFLYCHFIQIQIKTTGSFFFLLFFF